LPFCWQFQFSPSQHSKRPSLQRRTGGGYIGAAIFAYALRLGSAAAIAGSGAIALAYLDVAVELSWISPLIRRSGRLDDLSTQQAGGPPQSYPYLRTAQSKRTWSRRKVSPAGYEHQRCSSIYTEQRAWVLPASRISSSLLLR
jgi:hypothetical protein